MSRTNRIFIADDDEDILQSMAMILEFAGFTVTTTSDCKSILSQLNEKPDLILLDVWMSGCNGTEICRDIKADPALNHIPVLMVSASHEVAQFATTAGADGYLEKPFEMATLLSKVHHHLSSPKQV